MGKSFFAIACAVLLIASQPVWADENPILVKQGEMFAEAREVIKQITVHDVRRMIDEGEAFTLVDVRDPEELAAGVIAYDGLVTISRGKLELLAPDKLDMNERIVVVCQTGIRGILAAHTLVKLGYTNVSNIQCGIEGWAFSDYPIRNSLGTFVMK